MKFALVACALVACSVPVAQHAPDTGNGGPDAPADSHIDAPPDAPLAPAMLTASQGATDFGDVVVNQSSQKVTYTIENTGDVASGSLSVALDSSDAFALTDDTCSGMTLARHETCTFQVAFAPTAAGAAMTTVHATASPGGDLARDLSGNGLTPGSVDIVDTGYAFGALAVDAAPLTHTFVVRNAGQVSIGMPVPTITGATDSYAIDSNDCTAALAPAATCHVVVRFDPSTVGSKPGSLVVTSSPGGSDAATLSGTANAHVVVTKVGTGTGNVASNQPGVDCGSACAADFTATPVTLSATPDTGSTFDGWTGDCTGTGSCSLDLTGARSVSARFTAITPTLTVALAGNGTGSIGSAPAGIACSPTCSADFAYGASVTLTATAATGSTFTGWAGACSGLGTCTVTMDQARSVTATFALNTYTLTVSTSGNGSGTVAANPAGPTYPYNTQVTLTATASQGSTFAGWTGCTSSSNTCTVTMDQARSVSAAFTLNNYTLSIATAGTGSGTVAASPAGPSYPYNTMVTLTATPSQGSTFTGWSGACTGASTCIVTMSQAQTVTATFALQSYALTINYAGNGAGSVHANPPGGTYTYNTQVTLTQTPAAGSTFTGWGGACTGTSTCVVTMSQAQTVTATFTLSKYAVTATVSGSGTLVSTPAGIDCPGTQCTASFDYGTPLQLVATPATGWLFDHWTGACASATSATCTTSVTGATSVSVVFVHDQRTLTVQTTGNGVVTSQPAGLSCPSSCAAPFDVGSTVTLTATAGAGASFSGWGGACSGTAATCTVTIDQAYTVTATFTGNVYALTLGTTGNGSGTIAANPAGPNYAYNTTVTLTATPASGSQFAGWTGCTSSTNVCTVTMTQARTVTAAFTLVPETLTVSVNAGGSVTSAPAGISCGTSCSAAFDYGTQVTLSATPQVGYNFNGWTGACSGQTGATCTLTMTAAASAGASFAPQQIELDTAPIGNGTGTIAASPAGTSCGPGCATYAYGTSVTLTPTAATGSTFTGWGGACTGTASCVVSMTAAKSVTATFTLQQYALSTSTLGNGAGTVTGAGTYNYGTQVTVTQTPATGSVFTGWGGACTGTGACVVSMTAAKSVTATFALQQLTLSTSTLGNGAGTVTGAGTYNYGTQVTVTETPATGSVFTGWGGACTGTGACVVTMDQARSVTATFALQQLTLTTSTTGNGSGAITANPPGGTYSYGTQVTLTATAAQGSTFTGWTGCTSSSNVCVVTMTAATSVTASFTLQRFAVSATVTGSGTVSGTGTYDYGSQAVLTAIPNAGNVFTGWGGACAGVTGTSCTLTVTGPTSASATFAADIKQLSVAFSGTGSGTVSSNPAGINCTANCSATFPTNTQVTLTATAGIGTGFTGWTGCTSTTNTCTVTMDQARTVTATFTANSYTLTATAAPGGTIASNVGGINCGSSCSASIAYGTAVTLTASPQAGWTFRSWGGTAQCGTSPTCTFPMPANATSVTAIFDPSLTVQTSGASGSVSSTPAGISCGATCLATFPVGSQVALTAAPPAHTHTVWGGACASATGNQCTVTMDAVKTATARFDYDSYALTVSLGGDQTGSVTGGAISCPGTCSQSVVYNNTVTLTATPSAGSTFAGWGGACSGTASTCTVTVLQATSVTATFYRNTYTYTMNLEYDGIGADGFYITYPTTQTCSVDPLVGSQTCSATAARGTTITVTAQKPSRYEAWTSGPTWTGCDSVSGTYGEICTFTLNSDRPITISGSMDPTGLN